MEVIEACVSEIAAEAKLRHDELVELIHDAVREHDRIIAEADEWFLELRDLKIWRNTHKTFAEFCDATFQTGRRWGFYKIAAAEVRQNLTQEVDESAPRVHSLPNDKQARELAKLSSPHQQRQVWQQAQEEGKASTASLKETVKKLVPKPATKPEPTKPKAGREAVATKDRKEALAVFGKLVRALDRIGVGKEAEAPPRCARGLCFCRREEARD